MGPIPKSPPRNPETLRVELIKFRVSPMEKTRILEKAKEHGLILSDYCRRTALVHSVPDRTPESQKFRLAIINGLNNLNQIARHCNTYGMSPAVMDDFQNIIKFFKNLKSALS